MKEGTCSRHGRYVAVVEFAAGPPTRWRVVPTDGSLVYVWADCVSGLSGPEDLRDHSFETLMNIEPALQGEFEVTGRTPSDPRRVLVEVARFPREAVREVLSSWDEQ